jgi:UDP-N-acetylmuramoyl-L-alanyl-D-glutamate--2,6-diaminopimelate ligase
VVAPFEKEVEVSGRPAQTLRPESPSARSLAELASAFDLEGVGGPLDGLRVTGVTISSNDVAPGDLYVGMPGRNRHGAEFTDAALSAGAVAVLTDDVGASLIGTTRVPVLTTPDPRAVLGEVAAWVYRTGDAPLRLFGITGTNGKTSTAYLLDAVLRQAKLVTGLSTTAERRLGTLVVTSSLTTPEASETHALIARAVELGADAVTIEVSAQALTRHRVDGLVFDVVGFTNLSHDHLDDYGSMEEYFAAKRPLFAAARAKRGVVCIDTPWGERLAREAEIPVSTLSLAPGPADWIVELTDETQHETAFTLRGPAGLELRTRVPVIGRHMAMNGALAIVMAIESGVDETELAPTLESEGIVAYVPGRLECVSGDDGPGVFVDFAHSADAFESTLAAMRRVTSGRVIMVFGADGDRDASKRHDMGRVAALGSDLLVVTDFDSRHEDPAAIREALLDGARDSGSDTEVVEIASPEEAIRFAVSRADSGDSILWAGPGHQDYRDVDGVKIPHSARDEARAALREAGWMTR